MRIECQVRFYYDDTTKILWRLLFTVFRNGADQCGLMCIQSILLDRLEIDQFLTVPAVVGTIKAIRPQVIPTVVSGVKDDGGQYIGVIIKLTD